MGVLVSSWRNIWKYFRWSRGGTAAPCPVPLLQCLIEGSGAVGSLKLQIILNESVTFRFYATALHAVKCFKAYLRKHSGRLQEVAKRRFVWGEPNDGSAWIGSSIYFFLLRRIFLQVGTPRIHDYWNVFKQGRFHKPMFAPAWSFFWVCLSSKSDCRLSTSRSERPHRSATGWGNGGDREVLKLRKDFNVARVRSILSNYIN